MACPVGRSTLDDGTHTMIRLLTSGFLTRGAARRLSRAIPNPLVRTVAIAAAGYAIDRLVRGRRSHRRAMA